MLSTRKGTLPQEAKIEDAMVVLRRKGRE